MEINPLSAACFLPGLYSRRGPRLSAWRGDSPALPLGLKVVFAFAQGADTGHQLSAARFPLSAVRFPPDTVIMNAVKNPGEYR